MPTALVEVASTAKVEFEYGVVVPMADELAPLTAPANCAKTLALMACRGERV